jgi:spermidine/putrescine transport system permease protein
MIALGLTKYNFKGKKILNNLLYVPMIIPEIIFGIALLSLFVMINFNLGLTSIISAHITFSISFVTLVVMAKLKYLDKSIEEASLDLGATRWQTFIKIIFPNILPGIVAGGIFAFTLSIDDFVITFFTAGIGSSTLPLRIYTLIKFGVTPVLNAISTILIFITVLVIIAAYLLQKSGKLKVIGIVITSVIIIFFTSIFAYSLYLSYNREVLNIGNWADYISPDVIKKFEDETGILVNIDYFDPASLFYFLKLKNRQSSHHHIRQLCWHGLFLLLWYL